MAQYIGQKQASEDENMSGKHRLRWTPELRDRFEAAVKQLGGADGNDLRQEHVNNKLHQADNTSGAQINEALRMQKEIQRLKLDQSQCVSDIHPVNSI
ncbi:hypothetical protein QJS10_CPB21g01272 [Acorus calamus]|uniref:Uncharacterized protein n=1 Tax=Acorus calamus TaxID=4465 RepID=A0AAV9C8Q3_ACOCL|nr:hypothetical protein QJS10_CPB21g01272 [Acorus calamus]